MRTTITHLRSVAIASALVVALTACGGTEQTESADADVAEPTDDEAADEPSDADADESSDVGEDDDAAVDGDATSTDTVEARNINFEPADIEVAVGTTVTWVNADIVNHTVTSGPAGDPDGMFDESLDSGGDDATVTFDEAGTFDYYCDLHRSMVGTVTVTG
jgi:plastocyanin